MKKSLIALAVLASSGAVMAQSSVTLYGLVDAGVAHTSSTTRANVKTSQDAVVSSGANNSRWGFRGTEDLGNGLKANFVLESGFNTDTGTDAQTVGTAGTAFGRQAFVGLSGNFGAVTLGRQYTAFFGLFTITNNLGDSNLSSANSPFLTSVWGNGVANHQARASNSIAYTSPVYSGFSGAVVYGFGEDKNAPVTTTIVDDRTGTTVFTGVTPNTRNASYNASLHLKYANGPLLAGYAYQEELSASNATTPSTSGFFTTNALAARTKNQYHLLGASYNFGVAALTGSYSNAKRSTLGQVAPSIKDNEFQVGVSAPFGAANVAAGYSYSKSEVGTTTTKISGLSLQGTYSLSTRTMLYAGVAGTKTKNSSAKSSVVAAGVRHTF
jgi:predicted porin